MARLDDHADTTIIGRDGGTRGVIRGEYEKPWGGRDPETCQFKAGQLVGFASGDVSEIGVVNGLPVSPNEASRWSAVTRPRISRRRSDCACAAPDFHRQRE